MIETLKWLKGPEAKVVEKIGSAFPAISPPDHGNLVGADIEHLKTCDECRGAQHYFAGKTRETVLADERNYPHLVNAFDFFTPEAWHYYLPVFLIQDVIRRRDCFTHFWNYLEPGQIDGHWARRINLMDVAQCEALIEYLEFYGSGSIVRCDTEELSKIQEWWRGIYQEKLGSSAKRA